MPPAKDLTMLKADSKKFLIAMARKELEPIELAKRAGVSRNIIYAMRKGCYTKPKYFGLVAKALEVDVKDLVE